MDRPQARDTIIKFEREKKKVERYYYLVRIEMLVTN